MKNIGKHRHTHDTAATADDAHHQTDEQRKKISQYGHDAGRILACGFAARRFLKN